MIETLLALDPFDPAHELGCLTHAAPGAGAVVSFVGLVRSEGDAVGTLTLEHHPVLTPRSLAEIAAAATARFTVDAVRIVHRAGTLVAGEPIVFTGAAARHRREAFLAADFVMDLLKTEAVFWKRESGPGGTRWIEPRAQDRADAARWTTPPAGAAA